MHLMVNNLNLDEAEANIAQLSLGLGAGTNDIALE